ncbi:TPA: hypothetical protein NIU34_004696 [Klebsiella oxytoca]|nr:hypothetical protein [Klebsiella oxytoca]ELT8149682.1 hypothetical protein [Klebsiella oxytoca]ELT9463657.1 hypothetical protein [Klebsiella oxytoca]EME8413586.1 hypothetical protein [Klebsiella oxytoca]MBG2578398.1 hypothetical protein [Klebsiella oxytoca]MDK6512650.1 hypothetical protein [Klebsiella oxytoca]
MTMAPQTAAVLTGAGRAEKALSRPFLMVRHLARPVIHDPQPLMLKDYHDLSFRLGITESVIHLGCSVNPSLRLRLLPGVEVKLSSCCSQWAVACD